jgi:hypothetical protein
MKVLLFEPGSCHTEVTLCLADYLLELGFDVTVRFRKGFVEHGDFSLLHGRVKYSEDAWDKKPYDIGCFDGYDFVVFVSLIDVEKDFKIPVSSVYLRNNVYGVLHDRDSLVKLPGVAEMVKNNRCFSITPFDIGVMNVPLVWFGECTTPPRNHRPRFVTIGNANVKRLDEFVLAAEKLGNPGLRLIHIGWDYEKSLEKYRMPKDRADRWVTTLNRIETPELVEEMKSMDFYLPLKDNHPRSAYWLNKCTGDYQVIYGFEKPPVISSSFAWAYRFNRDTSIIYDDSVDGLADGLKKALSLPEQDYMDMRRVLIEERKFIRIKALNTLRKIFKIK